MLSHQMKKLLKNDRCLILAYDHGMEHGPVDFNEHNVDPAHIINIAEEAGYNAIAIHHGLAEKYYSNDRYSVPLLIKLNGKSSIPKIEPISSQICSVSRALKLGAEAVGYTIYLGSAREPIIFEEFANVVEEAHDNGIPVVAWVYPRGEFVKNDDSIEMTAYAARIALEMGADMVKLKYSPDLEGYKWVVKSAGRCKVLVAGGDKASELEFLKIAHDSIQAGATGLAVGRNIWQHPNPLKISEALKAVVFDENTPEEAMRFLE